MYSELASAYAVAFLQTFSKLSHSFRSCPGAFCALESFVLMVFVILDPAVVERTRTEIASAPLASIRRQISRQEALSPAAFAHQSTLTVHVVFAFRRRPIIQLLRLLTFPAMKFCLTISA